MFISMAYAAADEMGADLDALANAPTPMEAFMWNMGLVVVLVALFYVLLIMPQQRRFKEHSEMLSHLKKGDRVVTGGGLVGTVDKLVDDKEVLIDLGNGVKVTALRSMIQGKTEFSKKAANDQPKDAKSAAKDVKPTKGAKPSKEAKSSKGSKAKKDTKKV
ncbi:MAG: preprotein translocase subunit YajC [Alphaproteobacteria bacterium]